MRLSPRATRKELCLAWGQGFTVARVGDPRWLRHWDACRASRRPYIRVTPRRLYADVELDMLPAGRCLSEGQVTDAALILIRYGDRRSLRGWTARTLTITRVPLAQVQGLLAVLLDFLCWCEIRWAMEQEPGNLAVWIISTKGLGH